MPETWISGPSGVASSPPRVCCLELTEQEQVNVKDSSQLPLQGQVSCPGEPFLCSREGSEGWNFPEKEKGRGMEFSLS